MSYVWIPVASFVVPPPAHPLSLGGRWLGTEPLCLPAELRRSLISQLLDLHRRALRTLSVEELEEVVGLFRTLNGWLEEELHRDS